jgi:hypothetical protein
MRSVPRQHRYTRYALLGGPLQVSRLSSTRWDLALRPVASLRALILWVSCVERQPAVGWRRFARQVIV